MYFAVPLVAVALFLAACGKTPDQELKSKVPAAANGLFLIDGTNVTKTKMYAENKEKFLKDVRKASLPEDIFECRVLFFGSIKEEWGGFMIQSANKQVGKFFDYALADIKKDNNATVKDLKEAKSLPFFTMKISCWSGSTKPIRLSSRRISRIRSSMISR